MITVRSSIPYTLSVTSRIHPRDALHLCMSSFLLILSPLLSVLHIVSGLPPSLFVLAFTRTGSLLLKWIPYILTRFHKCCYHPRTYTLLSYLLYIQSTSSPSLKRTCRPARTPWKAAKLGWSESRSAERYRTSGELLSPA